MRDLVKSTGSSNHDYRKPLLFIPALALVFLFIVSLAAAFNEAPVASGPLDQVNPAISGQVVVWQDYRNKENPAYDPTGCDQARNCLAADIYARDLSTGIEQRLTTATDGMDPDIDGDRVAWRNWSTGKIIVYDLADGTRQNASTMGGTVQMITPAVSGSIVVWTDYRNSSKYGDIYMRDLSQPADEPVSQASADPAIPAVKKDKRHPDIDGDVVVWEDWRNAYQDDWGWWHNPDIYMKDLSTGVEQSVCTNTSDQYAPVVSGDRVYWMDYRSGNWDIYMLDLATGIESQVTFDHTDQSWPAADGDFVTWKDTRNGNEDIYRLNIVSGTVEAVTTDPASQKIPAVSGSTVAWMDKRAGNWDIYQARVDIIPPTVDSLSPSGYIADTSATIIATYSDEGDGIDTAAVTVTLDGSQLTGCSVTAGQADCAVTGLGEGHHTLTADAGDLAGNTAVQGTGSFDVDTRGPMISPPVIGLLKDTDITIEADVSDAGIGLDPGSLLVKLDGSPLAGCTLAAGHVSCSATGLSLGSHHVEILAVDQLANLSTLSEGFVTQDTVAPVVDNPQPTGIIADTSATISAGYSDPSPGGGIDTTSVSVSLDGQPLSGCMVSTGDVACNLSGLPEGDHQVMVTVADNFGNSDPFVWSFKVNTAGPAITNLQPAPKTTVNNSWTPVSAEVDDKGAGVDTASVHVYLDGADITTGANINGGLVQYQMAPAAGSGLHDGLHQVRIVAADLDGLTTEQTWSFTVTSPRLTLADMNIYWPSLAAYQQWRLMVDYRVRNLGTGSCLAGEVTSGSATYGVLPLGPLPVALGEITADGSLTYSFTYYVSPGVSRFTAVNNASCLDEGGNSHRFTGPPPA